MGKAHLASLIVFLVFTVAGLVLFNSSASFWAGFSFFVGSGLIGSVAAGILFNHLASPGERLRDLEDRVRNSDF